MLFLSLKVKEKEAYWSFLNTKQNSWFSIRKKKGKVINANALNTIFEAIVKMRTFQPMGIKAATKITDDINDSLHEASV